MGSKNNSELISKASPHTIQKFDLVSQYVEGWAPKLLNTYPCNNLVFIDCMCNSGLYYDISNKLVFGSPIRVAKTLRKYADDPRYEGKNIYLYFNDDDSDKINLLKQNLPPEGSNFHYIFSVSDANVFLKKLAPELDIDDRTHSLLFYDPFDASIDWQAIYPFFHSWSEIIINYHLMDPSRAISQIKKQDTKAKYENTYLLQFEKIVPYGSNKKDYENRLLEIIDLLKGNPNREYFVASFPFFNTCNSLIFDLVHCTSNFEGFKLYKETAWKVFNGQSSSKMQSGESFQLSLVDIGTIQPDERCYTVNNIVDYIQGQFLGKQHVLKDDIWNFVDMHPVFPTKGYKNEICKLLKEIYGAHISTSYIDFSDRKRSY